MPDNTDIIGGNRLIAEFHGWKHIPTPKGKGKGYWNFPECGKANWDAASFQYHSSWDWLMPVVIKIFKIRKDYVDGIAVTTWTTKYDQPLWGVERELRNPNLDKVYAAVVQFIQWYNSQKSNNG